MKTLNEIVEGLHQSIPADAVNPPNSAAGIYGEYVTAQWAMQEANNIFGVDGISAIDLLDEKMVEIPLPGYPFGNYVFISTVRVTIRYKSESGTVHAFNRIGRGVGTAQCPYDRQRGENVPVKTQQMDTAAKASLSDAIKNALMRTGQRLGAELYFDERMAQTLDFDIQSDRVTRRSEESGESPDAGDELERLATLECKYGFGKEKNFKGMTVAEMWNDEEGRKVFDWAVEKEATGFFNEKIRRYHELMSEQEDDAQPPAEGQRMITIWTGKEVPADAKPDWGKLTTNDAFRNMLHEAFDPEGRIKHFGPDHKRMTNHYKAHFNVDSGRDLTWEMLNALVLRCKEGEYAASFGYPEFYGEDTAQSADSGLEELDKDIEAAAGVPDEVFEKDNSGVTSVHDTPPIVIGPQGQQKVPSGIQKAVKEVGVESPDEWLWGTLLGEKQVDWIEGHTALALRVLETIEEGKIKHDNSTIIRQMWDFGVSQLGK